MKLLLMVHHDFVSVFYCFYEWFTRPQRVALLLCSVVTLMAADATVFATIMFKVIDPFHGCTGRYMVRSTRMLVLRLCIASTTVFQGGYRYVCMWAVVVDTVNRPEEARLR